MRHSGCEQELAVVDNFSTASRALQSCPTRLRRRRRLSQAATMQVRSLPLPSSCSDPMLVEPFAPRLSLSV